MKKQSFQSRLINAYLIASDRKSKYQERWFYSNPEISQPPKEILKDSIVSNQTIQSRNLWVIEPKEVEVEKTILFLHGGGFAKNFQKYHWKFVQRLSRELKARIYAPDYPLIPESNYKEVHSFVLEVYSHINSIESIDQLYVIGDSCGATIALNTSHRLKEIGVGQPKEFILLSPWLDLSLTNPQIDIVNDTDPVLDIEVLQKLGNQFAAELDTNDPMVSPIYADLRRVAPITILIGTRDIMLADCKKFKGLLASQPVVFTYREFEGMFHTWMYFDFPEGKAAFEMIANQIKHEPSDFEVAMQESEFGW